MEYIRMSILRPSVNVPTNRTNIMTRERSRVEAELGPPAIPLTRIILVHRRLYAQNGMGCSLANAILVSLLR
jgi:hypothetical protein